MSLRSKAKSSIEEMLEPFDRDWDPRSGWIIEAHEGVLRQIENLVRAVEISSGPAWHLEFQVDRWQCTHTPLAKNHLCHLSRLLDIEVLKDVKQIRFSERFYLFAEVCKEIKQLGLQGLGCTLRDRASLLERYQTENVFVTILRAKTRDRQFRDRCRHRANLDLEHASIGQVFVDKAFSQYSKLLVVRVDLAYSVEAIPLMTLAQLRKDLLRLWQLRRQAGKRLDKDSFVGYSRGIEFRVRKWFHVHVVLFFNGQDVRKDYFHGEQLGHLWRQATEGRGIYFNCSAKREEYENLYLGVIDAGDIQKRQWLLKHGMGYLAKTELYMPVLTTNLRRFQVSQLKRKKGRGGRSRLPLTQRAPFANHLRKQRKRRAEMESEHDWRFSGVDQMLGEL